MPLNIGSKIYLDKSWKITRQVVFLLILGIVVIGSLLAFIYREAKVFQKLSVPVISLPQKGKTEEEISKSLTVPEENREKVEELPPETIKSLTVPKEGIKAPKELPPEVIKDLTVPK